MTHGDLLHRAILIDPSDDLARLAYADWLEESGDDARAEFVRVQVALATARSRCGSESGDYLCRSMLCGRCPLIRRQDAAWLRIPTPGLAEHLAGLLVPLRFHLGLPGGPDHPPPVAHIRKGFAESIQCPLQTWLGHGHGRAIVRAHPVERVAVADCNVRPIDSPCGVWWEQDGRSRTDPMDGDLPPDIFSFIWDELAGDQRYRDTLGRFVKFASSALARSALGHAALTLARRAEGLPELPWKPEE